MRTIEKIITKVDCKFGAPMGRRGEHDNTGEIPNDKKVFDCAVPLSGDGAYDKGGAYWGYGPQLRVMYTKDLSFIRFYRKGE